MKIIAEQPPNSDCKVLYTDRKLTPSSTEMDSDRIKAFERYPWLEEVHNLLGVRHVSVYNYKIIIMKGRVFSFDNIIPEIETILQREFPKNLV